MTIYLSPINISSSWGLRSLKVTAATVSPWYLLSEYYLCYSKHNYSLLLLEILDLPHFQLLQELVYFLLVQILEFFHIFIVLLINSIFLILYLIDFIFILLIPTQIIFMLVLVALKHALNVPAAVLHLREPLLQVSSRAREGLPVPHNRVVQVA